MRGTQPGGPRQAAGNAFARTIYGEIFDNDEAFGLFCSIAASGEAQGGWENGKIAALVPGSQAGLAAKRRMMTSPQAEPPSAQSLGESLAALAVQVAALRGQVTLISQRLDRAGLRGDLDLAAASRNSPRPSPAHWTPPHPAALPHPPGSAWTARPIRRS